jgi:hypothetical protein
MTCNHDYLQKRRTPDGEDYYTCWSSQGCEANFRMPKVWAPESKPSKEKCKLDEDLDEICDNLISYRNKRGETPEPERCEHPAYYCKAPGHKYHDLTSERDGTVDCANSGCKEIWMHCKPQVTPAERPYTREEEQEFRKELFSWLHIVVCNGWENEAAKRLKELKSKYL